MAYYTTEEAIELVKAFEQRTLPRSEWTHAALLTVGLYYCLRYSFGTAINLMREGIQAINDGGDGIRVGSGVLFGNVSLTNKGSGLTSVFSSVFRGNISVANGGSGRS